MIRKEEMNKYISFGRKEEIIEYDEDMDYDDFLAKIGKIFKLKAGSFYVEDINKDNFTEIIDSQNYFDVHRIKQHNVLKRLDGKVNFADIDTVQEAKDFLSVYGFKSDESGYTPFYWAIINNNIEIVKLLLEYKSATNIISSKTGETILHWAVETGNKEMVKLILEKELDNIHKSNNYGETPLCYAITSGYDEIVELLLEKDFDNAYQADRENKTPLYWAEYYNNTNIIKLLEDDMKRRNIY